jgi:hypothetical protein
VEEQVVGGGEQLRGKVQVCPEGPKGLDLQQHQDRQLCVLEGGGSAKGGCEYTRS